MSSKKNRKPDAINISVEKSTKKQKDKKKPVNDDNEQ
jgi:hypothetical protein